MTSILTNVSAMTALTTLRSIGSQLGTASDKMSSGLRVAKASDDVAYWSISTKMRSDTKAMEAATESVGLAKGVVDTAYAGLQNVRDAFVEIRNIAITASSMQHAPTSEAVIPAFYPDPEFAKSDVHEMELRVQELLDQARNSILSSSFAGVNLLYHPKNCDVKASQQEFNFVTGFVDGKVQTLDVKAIDTLVLNDDFGSYPTTYPEEYNPEKTLLDGKELIRVDSSATPSTVYWFNLDGVLNRSGDPESVELDEVFMFQRIENHVMRFGADRKELYDGLVNRIDQKLDGLTSKMALIGSLQRSLDLHEENGRKRIDAINRGVSRLVDADMEETSVRLQALETQKQLAASSLQIANSAQSMMLQLFQ
ncbi:flagellin [Agrobacterium larrymoorei]|uniref:Flagellin n=1 Tax=Agrobacterium larrymoorei TaxID=160699 RepID=A0AAJ2BD32_9HYPH|nr:flagellin [Agrobacterium larrymoorei]MDR6104221.1 flagellin [Agrobacterium larrymoorei]